MDLTTIISTLVIIAFILLKDFFFTYNKEKAKNLATKEDIELITAKVENLKLELANSHFQKNDYLEKRKEALLSFYEQFILFSETYLKNISFIDVFLFNPEKIRENTEKIITEKGKLEKEFWKVTLYECDDVKFLENIKTILLYQYEYYRVTIEFLWRIENNSLALSKTHLNSDLAQQRKKIKEDFVKERDELDKVSVTLPNKMMVQIKNKYLGIIK